MMTRIYDFDHTPERRGTGSLKWERYDGDILPLWVADMDFLAPDAVIQTLQAQVAHGIFGYPSAFGGPGVQADLSQVLVARMERLYGWHISVDDLIFIPGVVTGFNLACHALTDPQSGVLIQTPVYPPFLSVAQNAHIARQDNPLLRLPDGRYEIDFDAFEAAITEQTRLFILCNPHNPVGRVFRQDELERMAEICLRHGVLICSDEIHCDLLYRGQQHIPIASLSPEIAQNTITLMAPSKTFNIAGLQCSFAIVQNAELRNKLIHAGEGLVGWVNAMGLAAGLAAYQDGQEWLDQLLPYLEANRDFLYDYVRAELPGIQMAKPEGTYLAWLDCRELGLAPDPYEFFIKNARVALNKGATFGHGGEDFVRLNFGCSRATLTEALQRMKHALK